MASSTNASSPRTCRRVDTRHNALRSRFFIPEVPLICPARKRPRQLSSPVWSKLFWRHVVVSTAYPTRIISACSSAGCCATLQLHISGKLYSCPAHRLHPCATPQAQEDLMRTFISETYYLIFDRGTIARSDPFNNPV